MPAYRCCSLPVTCLGCVSSMWLLAGKVIFATGQAKHALGSKPAPRKTNAHASTHTASLRDRIMLMRVHILQAYVFSVFYSRRMKKQPTTRRGGPARFSDPSSSSKPSLPARDSSAFRNSACVDVRKVFSSLNSASDSLCLLPVSCNLRCVPGFARSQTCCRQKSILRCCTASAHKLSCCRNV